MELPRLSVPTPPPLYNHRIQKRYPLIFSAPSTYRHGPQAIVFWGAPEFLYSY